MKKFGEERDPSRANIVKLIDFETQYRQMQYSLLEQFNLCLQDPKLDSLYMDTDTLMKYRGYIESDLNGTAEHSSTTQIIKEFKKLLENYDNALNNYDKGGLEAIAGN